MTELLIPLITTLVGAFASSSLSPKPEKAPPPPNPILRRPKSMSAELSRKANSRRSIAGGNRLAGQALGAAGGGIKRDSILGRSGTAQA